jgi:hypothetical protein
MLCSLTEVKDFLEIATDVETFDNLLTMFIKGVSGIIQTTLNRNLKKEQRTEYFQTGKRKYFTSAWPIDTAQTISITVDSSTQTVNDDYYLWDDKGMIEFDYKTTYSEPKQVSITYTGGYATITSSNIILNVPDDLKLATIFQVVFMFRNRDKIGTSSISMPDGSVSMMNSFDLLPGVKNLIKPYRKLAGDL